MTSKKFDLIIDGNHMEVAADVRDIGKDLLFFVHGLGCSKNSFHHFWDRIDFKEYGAIIPDLIGFGRSSKPERFSYTMEAQARIYAEILKRFSDKNLHIIAHSMGNAVALLFPDEILSRAKTYANVEGNLIDADCSILSRKIVDAAPAAFQSNILPEIRETLNRLGENYTEIDAASTDALYRSAESLVAWSDSNKLLDRFFALKCRKAYFFGEENAEHPTIARIKDIQKIKIENSGHFPMNDNPKEFYDKLFSFVTMSD
jgi:pimeloyl-ACP methyl ester carboxylesterase